MKTDLRFLLLAGALTALSACGSTRDSIVFAGGPSSSVQLLNAFSGRPLRDSTVRLRETNPLVCQQPPCSTDSTIWTGRTDQAGRVVLAKSAITPNTIVDMSGYQLDLLDNATRRKDGAWDLELTAKDSSGNDQYPLKLFDADSKKPFVDTPATFEFADTHGGTHTLNLVTNALGYVFIPAQIANAGLHESIKVRRFHLAFIDFKSMHHDIYLQPNAGGIGRPE